MEDNVLTRLKELRETALRNVEKGFDEIHMIFNKNEVVDTGIVDTSKLRVLIQATKELSELYSEDNGGKADVSLIIEALRGEDSDV